MCVALKEAITKCLVYVALITIVGANLCENPENKEVVSCWNGNYSSFDFNQVEVLHFVHNRVKSWWIFENLTITNQLFVDYNLLKDFNNVPESFFDLKELSITHNLIKVILKDSLTYFRKLTTLRLCHNQITEIHADSFSRMLMKDLYIRHNSINNLDFVNQLERVEQLALSSNNISNLDSVTNSLPKLTHVDLSNNSIGRITTMRVLYLMTAVIEVNLTNNPLVSAELETELPIPMHQFGKRKVTIYVNDLNLRCDLEKLFVINLNDKLCWLDEQEKFFFITKISASAVLVVILFTILGAYFVYSRRKNVKNNIDNHSSTSPRQRKHEGNSQNSSLLELDPI